MIIGLVAVLALGASSCGDDGGGASDTTTTTVAETTPSDDDSTSPTTTVAAVELTASYRGVTADSIKVGVVLFDLDAILELGVDVGYGDHTQHYQVVIDEMNAAGGILGRRIRKHLLAEGLRTPQMD